LDSEFRESVDLVLEYLKCFWNKPNYDCWEENRNKIHSSTIGCIYGGLNSIGSLRGGALGFLSRNEEILSFKN